MIKPEQKNLLCNNSSGIIVERVLGYAKTETEQGTEYPGTVLMLLFAAYSQCLELEKQGGNCWKKEVAVSFNSYLLKHPEFTAWVSRVEDSLSNLGIWPRLSVPEFSRNGEPLPFPSKNSFLVGIDGPNGVGKTTVGKLLVDSLTGSVKTDVILVPREAMASNFSHQLLKGQFRAECTHSLSWGSITETLVTSAAIYHHYSCDVPRSGIGIFDRGEASRYAYNVYNITTEYGSGKKEGAFALLDSLLKMYHRNNLAIFLEASPEVIMQRLSDAGDVIPEDFRVAIPMLNALYRQYLDRIGSRGVLVNAKPSAQEILPVVAGIVERRFKENGK